MRPRNTLAALVVLAILGGIIYLEYRVETGAEARAEADKRVLDMEAEDRGRVAGLDLIRPGGTVSVRREEERWNLTSPVKARADGEAVNGALATLESLEISERLSPGGSGLETYGLRPPQMEIAVHLRGLDEPVRLAVGGKVPVGSARYAMRQGEDDLLIVSSSVESLLDTEAGDLRYRDIVGMDAWEVQRLALERDGVRVELERHGSGWRLRSPEQIPAVGSNVNSRLLAITALRAEEFAPEGSEPGGLGLHDPEITLEVAAEEGTERKVRLARAREGGWWAVRSDMEEIFRLPADAGEALRLDPGELRDPRIAPVERHTITGIGATVKGKDLTLVKDENANWRWGGPAGALADVERVADFIDALADCRAETLVPPGKGRSSSGSGEPPLLSLELHATGSEPLSLVLRECDAEACRVASSATDHLYVLPASAAGRLVESAGQIEPPRASAAGQESHPGGDPSS